MLDLKNDKKNNNHTVSAATIFTLAIIMMTALTIAYPAAATPATATTMPQPVTVATDNQSVNVLVSWEPAEIEPGGDTEFTLEFQDPSSGEPIDHVNYDFEIMDQNGETVQSMTDLHTHSGSDEQTVTFDTPGSFNLVTTIIGTGIDPPFDTSRSGTAQTVIPVGQQLAGATEGGTPGTGNATAAGGNATTAGTGGNQSDVRMNLEQALMALQSNDTQSAMTFLDMALSALGGNATTTAGATNATAALGGTTAEGGATGGEGGGGGAEGEEGEGGEEGGTD
jgi:hypothetical protein